MVMSKLLKYSIETDQTVLLQYADSPAKRVPISQVEQHVGHDDLKKIQTSVRMRQNFFKRHLPKLSIVAICGGLIALGGLSQNQQLQQRISPSPDAKPTTSPVEAKKAVLPTPKIAPIFAPKDSLSKAQEPGNPAKSENALERIKKQHPNRGMIDELLRR